jgi:hypothetical protein
MFFETLPRLGLFRSFTLRLAGDTDQEAWHSALVEIEDALVPGVHHRRTRRRPIHDPRAVGTAATVRRCRVRPQLLNGCTPRRPVYPGNSVHLLMGLGVEGSRRNDAKRGTDLVDILPARRCE